MKVEWIAALVVGAAVCCRAAEADTDTPVAIGQPTVFWHNGQWQTYKDGVWRPYHDEKRQEEEPVAMQPEMAPEQVPPPEEPGMYPPYFVDGIYVGGGGHNRRRHHRPRPTPYGQAGQPVGGLGQTTIGIGPQQPGLGQTTIGIGPQTPGIGQTTIGMGPQQPGLGQTTIGIGQPATASASQTKPAAPPRATPLPARRQQGGRSNL
jgi:hypothetical protein